MILCFDNIDRHCLCVCVCVCVRERERERERERNFVLLHFSNQTTGKKRSLLY